MSNRTHLELHDEVLIVSDTGKKVSEGQIIELGSKENGHFQDHYHYYRVQDYKDNSIRWFPRDDIRKKRV